MHVNMSLQSNWCIPNHTCLQTLHCACRIAEVLVSLQKVGNVRYIRWKMEFYCQPNLVVGLHDCATKMEGELKEWNEKVKSARGKFYELNYYTTRQLLVLRSELGKLKVPSSVPYQCQAQVMALLQSISCEISQDAIEKAVNTETERASETNAPYTIPETGTTAVVIDASTFTSNNQPLLNESVTNPSEDFFSFMDEEDENTERKLSVSDLNQQQLENFRHLTEKMAYPKQFALNAIEECHTGNLCEISKWVEEHEEELDDMLQCVADEESAEGESEGEEEEKISFDTDDSTSEKSQNDEQYEPAEQGMFVHICNCQLVIIQLILHC